MKAGVKQTSMAIKSKNISSENIETHIYGCAYGRKLCEKCASGGVETGIQPRNIYLKCMYASSLQADPKFRRSFLP